MATTGTYRVWYTTREEVMRAADIKASAYMNAEIDRAIASGARDVDTLCRLGDATRSGFAPWLGTRRFDWPASPNNSNSYRFWLNQHKLLSQAATTSGGIDITSSVLLEPSASGPPYTHLDVDQNSVGALSPGSSAGQRSLIVTGLWAAAPDVETSNSAWKLSVAIAGASDATATIAAPIGVGSVIRIDSERIVITERSWVTSGQTGSLTANANAQTLAVADGTQFLAGETLLLDAERVLIQDIAGNNLFVKRAADGTTLAAHTTATIYWPRLCSIDRGALGTTAVAHALNAPVYVWRPPASVRQLNIAYALDGRAQEAAAYARTIGTGDSERNAGGGGLKAIEDRVFSAFGRKARTRAV